jgi:hypothetical protein
VCENPKEPADLSTTLRSGRDDNSVAATISYFSWKRGISPTNKFVISTGAQRSGEICGFFSVLTQISLALIHSILYGTAKAELFVKK